MNDDEAISNMRFYIVIGVLTAAVAAGGWFVVKKTRPTAKSVASSKIASCESVRPTLNLNFKETYVEKSGYRGKRGEQMVSFDWELVPQLSRTKPDYCPETFTSTRLLYTYSKWYLVRSRQPNPEHNEKNYWYRSVYKYANNAVPLNDLASGIHHFRVCLWLGDRCLLYSNDVTIKVSSNGVEVLD